MPNLGSSENFGTAVRALAGQLQSADSSLGRRMAPDTTDTTLRPLPRCVRGTDPVGDGMADEQLLNQVPASSAVSSKVSGPCQWYQGPKISPCPVPKFPDEPKFGMVPPSTPDRLLFGRDADVQLLTADRLLFGRDAA